MRKKYYGKKEKNTYISLFVKYIIDYIKLDGVGPDDNRPSPD